MVVHGFHLPNARPAITSAYNGTRQKSLAPPFIHLHILHNRGQWMGTEAKRSFLSLNKRPLRQIVLPRLISFGLFFLAPHEGICGRGQTFHLIKDTFHMSSPLSLVISLFTHLAYLSVFFLSSIIGSLKVPFTVTVPFRLALDAFFEIVGLTLWCCRHMDTKQNFEVLT